MTQAEIDIALTDIQQEQDGTVKNLKLASFCSALFRERGIELVVVDGSAIEFYTEGAYTSGDVDLCVVSAIEPLTMRLRQQVMGLLNAKGGTRSWQVAGSFVDILGVFENMAETPTRRISAPYGDVLVGPVEELIVERLLVAVYPQEYRPSLDCAKKLIAAVLRDEVEVNWLEVKRLAKTNAYSNWPDVRKIICEEAKALNVRSPYDPNE